MAEMLTIRWQQLGAFCQQARESFVALALAHVRRFFGDECARLEPDELREVVDAGIRRAARYGVVAERDVLSFLNVMFVFGRTFDQELDWARDILVDPEIRGGDMRMMELSRAATRHASEAEGLS
jgi:hypothetical protein